MDALPRNNLPPLSLMETTFNNTYISTAASTAVKSGRGKLHSITLGETAAGAITIIDGNTFTPALLTGGASATAHGVTWTAVEDGEFTITIDGTAYDITGLDFSETTDSDDIAAVIQAGIRAATGSLATVVWSTNKFIITSADTTGTSEVSVTSAVTDGAGTDISGVGATAFMDCETGVGTPTGKVGLGTTLGVLKASIAEQTFIFDLQFNTGLTVTTAGASKLSVNWL